MSEQEPLAVELLSPAHDRNSFDCGVEPLNRFLKQFALQNQKRNFVRTYVCCRGRQILGFYSLAFGETRSDSAPPFMTKGMGKYAVPSMILARLAVALSQQGKGLGVALLKDAVMRTKQAAQIAGLKALVVHAKVAKVQAFYAKYGFIPSLGDPFTLFFPLDFDL